MDNNVQEQEENIETDNESSKQSARKKKENDKKKELFPYKRVREGNTVRKFAKKLITFEN